MPGAYDTIESAIAGLLYGSDHRIHSRVASTAIPFGSAIYLPVNNEELCNATHDGVKVPDGIASFVQKYPGSYEAQDVINFVETGMIYVPVATAVQANKPLYITNAGVWTDVVGSNVLCKGMFRSSTTGAGIALVELFTK